MFEGLAARCVASGRPKPAPSHAMRVIFVPVPNTAMHCGMVKASVRIDDVRPKYSRKAAPKEALFHAISSVLNTVKVEVFPRIGPAVLRWLNEAVP